MKSRTAQSFWEHYWALPLYIPTRYPNGFEDGKPADYYTEADSRQAIGCVEAILRFCADRLSR